MSVRKPVRSYRKIIVPPAFRGNCDCGRWLIIPISVPADSPIYCECGRSYWYDPDDECFHRHEHAIVFLDIDGVLINLESRSKGHPRCVGCLNVLTKRANAVIVVSASRRKAGLETVRETLQSWGVTGKIVNITPDLSKLDKFWIAVQRGWEIQEWLKCNKRNTSGDPFVILDDEADMAHLDQFLVRTQYKHGLTEHDVTDALKILGDLSNDTQAIR